MDASPTKAELDREQWEDERYRGRDAGDVLSWERHLNDGPWEECRNERRAK